MDHPSYLAFTAAIVSALEGRPDVVGIVATGSMARVNHPPDEWSDHDFWVITEPGHEEPLRNDRTWLPSSERIVLSFRETRHGVKALYDDGHLVEYAVFSVDELGEARATEYRVLLDRGGIEARMERLRNSTRRALDDDAPDDEFLIGQFLTNIVVGVGRYARGEETSGHDLVKGQAVGHLLALVARHAPRGQGAAADDLDARRRVEQVYPAVWEALRVALASATPTAAASLLDIAQAVLGERTWWPVDAVTAVRAVIARASGDGTTHE